MASSGRMVDVIDRFAWSAGVDTATLAGASIGDRWDALRRAGLEDPGLRFAAWVDLALIGGVIPPLLANCADVGTLLQTLVRFHPLWGEDTIVLERTDRGAAVVRLEAAASAGPGGAVHPDTRDAFFAILVRMLGQVSTPPVLPERRWHRRSGSDTVVFSAEQLRVQLTAADPSVAQMLSGYAEAELRRQGGWLDQVRHETRSNLARPPSLRFVAERLAYSPRTLQQRLRDNGTSFSAVLDDERRTRALALLSNPDVAVSLAATETGFSSHEAFSRAFRRWTGLSPTQWRRGANL